MYETLSDVADGLREQFERLAAHGPNSSLSIEQRTTELAECQRAINTLSAIQDLHLAHLAATEDVPCEDGTTIAVEHPLGSTRLDAAALASESLGLADLAAQRRVDEAIWLCTDGRIALNAKGAGRIDQFKASILAEELREADPEVVDAVLTRLEPRFGSETAGPLRRRTRRVINTVAPEMLRLKAARARGDRRVERWAGEPGMDHWLAVLPADQAGPAFAAIDRTAHERLSKGLNETIDNARADALIDLILGNCTGTVGVQLAVPTTLLLEHAVTDTEVAALDPGELISVEGLSATGPVQLRRSSLQTLVRQLVTALTGTTGTTVGSPTVNDTNGVGEGVVAENAERAGELPAAFTAKLVGCDATTGAMLTTPLDPADLTRRANSPQLTSQAHDAPHALQELVRARDRHCRFPGCTINAHFCDLDHVLAWPAGPTTATNLICLCRRHHRIKQRPGWTVRLLPNGQATWTDPTGRQRTTHPTNHLDHEPPHHENLDQGALAPARKVLRPQPIDPSEPTEIPFRHAQPRPQHPAIPRAYETSPDYISHVEHALEHILAEAEALTTAAATHDQAGEAQPEPRVAKAYEPPPF